MNDLASSMMSLSILIVFLSCSSLRMSTTTILAALANFSYSEPVVMVDSRQPMEMTKSEFWIAKFAQRLLPSTPTVPIPSSLAVP